MTKPKIPSFMINVKKFPNKSEVCVTYRLFKKQEDG